MNGFDYGFWGFILGSVGTILSTMLVLIQVYDRLRAGSAEREKSLLPVFRAVYPPLKDLKVSMNIGDTNGMAKSAGELLNFLYFGGRERIRMREKEIRKESPELCENLFQLLSAIERLTGGIRSLSDVHRIYVDAEIKKLVPILTDRLSEWLEKRA